MTSSSKCQKYLIPNFSHLIGKKSGFGLRVHILFFFASERQSNRHGRIDLFVYQFKLAWRLYLANIARDWVLWYRFPWSKVPFTRVWLLLASIRKSSQILQILSFTVKKAHWVNEQGRGRHWRLMVGEQRFGLINGWVVKSPFIKAVNFLIVQNVL